MSVIADDINQEIAPYEYALVVFDMFADYLVYNYKKLNKTNFDFIRNGMNKEYIHSFKFPAPFEEQQYSLDESRYGLNPIGPGESWENSLIISPKEEYLKHYPF